MEQILECLLAGQERMMAKTDASLKELKDVCAAALHQFHTNVLKMAW
jgi:hypothetical protein